MLGIGDSRTARQTHADIQLLGAYAGAWFLSAGLGRCGWRGYDLSCEWCLCAVGGLRGQLGRVPWDRRECRGRFAGLQEGWGV
ncbi:hypothetical protein GCM10009716_24560 [Streptomyces sodiiphilus]|uniref:Uncharacterized protein n=1 Tax=Streptomyces sodiiphilus TaxID=226217 RepID=A0ABP5AJZ6_9ACTN